MTIDDIKDKLVLEGKKMYQSKENEAAAKKTYADTKKKIDGYNKPEGETKPNEYISDVQPKNDELANLIKHDGGMEMLDYEDREGNAKFIDRVKQEMGGDGKKGESNKKFWEDSDKANDKEDEIRKKTKGRFYGADYEFNNADNDKEPSQRTAFAEGKMKRVVFKETKFKDRDHVLKLIPKDFIVEGLVFEMYDGISLYKIECINNLAKHCITPKVISEYVSPKNNEKIKRIQEISNYKPVITNTSYTEKKINESKEVQNMINFLRKKE